jgi:hypothetical protein
MARTSWDKQPLQSNAYNDVEADLEEKEAIEQEITRRWRDGLSLATFGHISIRTRSLSLPMLGCYPLKS